VIPPDLGDEGEVLLAQQPLPVGDAAGPRAGLDRGREMALHRFGHLVEVPGTVDVVNRCRLVS
jgi:hypothetical protein